ncbi:hypothetical protein L7F22_003623 [Adiantum nelumboides]|nr:hypothetical protein [Adiantum nelumboides]
MSPPLPAQGAITGTQEHGFGPSLSSASWQVPEHVAGFLCKVLGPMQVAMMGFFLFLLSTRLGTLALCGTHALVKGFPFLQPFPKLPPHKREQSMRGWAISRFISIQVLFKALKGAAGYCFFARADSHGHNPIWQEIGYYLPHKQNSAKQQKRPLESKVIDVKKEAALCNRLGEFGFSAIERVHKGKQAVDVSVECDAVVVGSGSGGGVVASVLAKAGLKVLVIEKGDYFARGDYSLIEASSGMAMIEGPNALLSADGSVVVKAGSTVGGGSAINWSASLRTPDHVLREWADKEKLELFKDEKYQKALDTVCDRINAKVVPRKESLQNKVLREGCVKLGYHVEDVACNVVGEHYCGSCEFGCVSGAKQSTAETWLVDAVDRGSLILSGCKVQQVLHRKGIRKERQATGVVAATPNGKLYVQAQVVVAAAGALQTPLLLRRSGLRNQHIGRNLHLHPVVLAWGYLPPAGKDDDADGVFEGGIITACCRELALENSGYGAVLQCPCIHPGAFSFIAPWVSATQYKHIMQRYSRTCIVFALTRDRTCGEVSEGANGSVRVDYELSPTDKTMSLQAVQLAVRVLAASPGVAEVGTMSMDADSSDPADIEDYVARIASRGIHGLNYSIQSAHQMGTCRMGVEPSISVVDPRGECWEVEGLFVGDSSVFPTAIGVNPMVTVQAIAFCTSQNIVKFLRSS